MSVFNGDNLIVYMDSGSGKEPVAMSTDCKITVSNAEAKATTKDSGGWEEIIPGNNSFTIDVNGLVDFHPSSGKLGVSDLMDAVTAKTEVTLYFQKTSEITGDESWWGIGYCNKCEMDSKQGAVVTYSAAFKGTGALTKVTN